MKHESYPLFRKEFHDINTKKQLKFNFRNPKNMFTSCEYVNNQLTPQSNCFKT